MIVKVTKKAMFWLNLRVGIERTGLAVRLDSCRQPRRLWAHPKVAHLSWFAFNHLFNEV